ncbi:hypothetical protein FB451DRAFT_1477304 [Mycena latifolia]|nr:hypothetical protein FB451DRAFT_1477304 [Mycena latifolia]
MTKEKMTPAGGDGQARWWNAAAELSTPAASASASASVSTSTPAPARRIRIIRIDIHPCPRPAHTDVQRTTAFKTAFHRLAPVEYSTWGRFEPSMFRSLRLERAMIVARHESTPLAQVPCRRAAPPSMVALQHLTVHASNPAPEGLLYTPAFSATHVIFASIARLTTPSMDLVQALSRAFGTALASAPALHYISIADVCGDTLVMLLPFVLRSERIPALKGAGIDDQFMAAFAGSVEQLVLARLDPAPLLSRLRTTCLAHAPAH